MVTICGGDVVNRTCGTHNNLCFSLFLQSIFGPIYYGPPVILRGGIINRAYGTDKHLYYSAVFTITMFGPIYYACPPVLHSIGALDASPKKKKKTVLDES